MGAAPAWLDVQQRSTPLIVSLPHTGTEIPRPIEERLVSPWLGRKDTDWWLDRLYGFAGGLGATVLRTSMSRSVIDVNRDPDGTSLYPGQATTALCPETSFDGEPLYRAGGGPDAAETVARRRAWFDPYHQALAAEIARLRALHGAVVLYDAHAIRSVIPRLFDGVLPHVNIGTNDGASCQAGLQASVEAACGASAFPPVSNARFKGGYITRHYGRPRDGVHAIQVELACRGYMGDPEMPAPDNWPALYDEARAAPMLALLRGVLLACL